MSFGVYHQLGFREVWNLDIFQQDGVGDGFILSPRHLNPKRLDKLSPTIKGMSIFDPQFFVPGYAAGCLSDYHFFPNNVAGDFETASYCQDHAADSADLCVTFQNDKKFQYTVIPTRYFDQMPANYIEYLDTTFVRPFVEAINTTNGGKKVLLQLVLSDSTIKDQETLSDILNWVTGIPEIDGVYLITDIRNRQKQVKDPELLYAKLKLVNNLKLNGMVVALGYLNTEAFLLTIADPDILTIGTYERTRMFNIGAFLEPVQSGPPTPRIYYSRLLQSIEYPYLEVIRRFLSDNFLDHTGYLNTMTTKGYKPHFSKADAYKHHLFTFWNQLNTLKGLAPKARYEKVSKIITEAIGHYNVLDSKGVVFDLNNNGSHLAPWLTAANMFAIDMGWRK